VDDLVEGSSALDVVTDAVISLESCPHLNAGVGSVFNCRGEHELDASIMCGSTGRAGSVSCVKSIEHPILAARGLLESGGHVMLVGEGAEAFAAGIGLKHVDNSHFSTPNRLSQLEAAKAVGSVVLDGGIEKGKMGTVGAVAIDKFGNLAAATSTGGMTNKQVGRVGDTPCIGAGTFSDTLVAVSCTGSGEAFMRVCAAKEVACAMEFGGHSVSTAAELVLKKISQFDGSGGIIAVASNGDIALPFNTEGMFRGFMREGERPVVGIYRGDERSA